MSLDIPTVILVVAFIDAICGVILLAAYLMFARTSQAPLWWGGVPYHAGGGRYYLDGRCESAVGCHYDRGLRRLSLHRGRSMVWNASADRLARPALAGHGGPRADHRDQPAASWRGASDNAWHCGGRTEPGLLHRRDLRADAPAGEQLRGYLPLALLFMANVIVVGLAPFGGLGNSEGGLPPIFSLVGLIYLESHLFVIGTTIFVIAALRERKELAERKQASLDDLTGLPNRRGFTEMGHRLIACCSAEGKPLGVAVIDLDSFKSVNDRFGHAMGDAVLKRFARVAQASLRTNDVIGRIGGEEFAILLHGSDPVASFAIIERIRRAFQAEAEFIEGVPVRATLCAGVAGASTMVSMESLLNDADIALYRAKNGGRNRVQTFTPLAASDGTITQIA